MAGPIGHGVAKALREARDKGVDSRLGGRGLGGGGPPWWAWLIAALALLAAMAWASMTLQ